MWPVGKPAKANILRWISVIAAIAMLIGPPALAAVEQGESRGYLVDAQKYLQKGDLNAAVIQLKNALKSEPDNADARLLLGQIYLRLGQGPAAEKELRFARRSGMGGDKVVLPMSQAYLLQGKYQEAFDELTAVGAEATPDILALRAEAQVGLGRKEEAEKILLDLVRSSPQYVGGHIGLARLYVRMGRPDDAEKQVDEALSLAPEASDALVLKGELRRARRDLESAVDYFSRAIKANPRSVLALLGRAAASIDLNRTEEAGRDLQSVDTLIPRHPYAAHLKALMLARQKKFREAKDALLSAGSALDAHMPSVYLLGALSYALGEYEQAESHLSRFVAAFPTHVPSLMLLGATLLRKGAPQEAIRFLRPALDREPENPRLLALLGTAYLQNRQFADGTEMLERAAAAAPEASAIRTQLALGHLAAGASDRAVDDLQTALNMDPDATNAALLLAHVHLRNRKFDDALATARRLHEQQPENPLPVNLMGAAMLGKGDPSGARKQFEDAVRLSPQYFPAHRNLAELDIRDGHPEKADARFTTLLAENPKNVRAMSTLAELAMRRKLPAEATKWLERAVAIEPAPAIQIQLANLYLQTNEQSKAMAVARDLERRFPDNPMVIEMVGRAQVASGETHAATMTFQRLADRLPDSVSPLLQLARAQEAAKDWAGARATLQKAGRVAPDDVRSQVALADLEADQNRFDESRAAARRVIEKKPDGAVGYLVLGGVEMRARQYPNAVAAFAEAHRRQPSSVTAVRLFQAQLAAGRGAAGLGELSKWVTANPDDRQVRLVLANGYLQNKKFAEAIREFERLAVEAPDNVMVLNNLAWLYQAQHDARAVDAGRRAYELARDQPQVMDTYGWILVQNNDAEKGLELLRRASVKAPQMAEIRYHMAVALHRVGRSDEARRTLEDLMATGGDFEGLAEARALLRQLSGG